MPCVFTAFNSWEIEQVKVGGMPVVANWLVVAAFFLPFRRFSLKRLCLFVCESQDAEKLLKLGASCMFHLAAVAVYVRVYVYMA